MKLNIQLFAVSKKTTFSESVNEVNNSSNLSITISFSANNSQTWFASKTLKCTCNGSTQSKNVALSKGGTVTATFTFADIKHNDDGKKSVSWNWSIATGTSALGTLSDSGTFNLTQIQRNSTFDKSNWSTAEIPVETPKTVTIKQNRSDIYHKLLYRFIDKNSNVWKTFAVRDNPTLTNSQYTINYSEEELSAFYLNCTSKWSSLISIELYTYTDANLTKQLGEADSVWYVGTIINATPEIKNNSVVDSLDLTSLTGSTSRLIRYVSKPILSWEIELKKGANLISQLLNGANAESPITKDWMDTYLLQIVDSRGQNASHVFNLDPSQNPNVVPYVPLTITLDADRPLPTTGEIKLDVKGSFYPGKFKADGPNNTITVTYCIREQKTADWETGTIECSVENNSYTGSITLSNKNYQKNFEVYVYISDMIGTAYNGTSDNPKVVPKGEPILALSDELVEIFGKLTVKESLETKNILSKNKFNMHNLNSFTAMNITYFDNSFTVTGIPGQNKAAAFITTLQPGTYILSGTVTGVVNFVEFYRNGNWDGTISLNTPFILNETTELMMYFYGSVMSNTDSNTSTFTNIQLEESSFATEYVPYLNLKEVMPLLPVFLPMGVVEEYVYTTDLSYFVIRIGKIVILNIRTLAFKSIVPHGSVIIYGLPPAKNGVIFYLYGGNGAKGDATRVYIGENGSVNIHYGSNTYYGNSPDMQYSGTLIYETTDSI